jgi:hypothetical protein
MSQTFLKFDGAQKHKVSDKTEDFNLLYHTKIRKKRYKNLTKNN